MLCGAAMLPHPPIGVPEIGGEEIHKMQATEDGYQQAAAFASSCRPDTFIVLSPHAVMYRDYFNISSGSSDDGDFRRFRARQVSFHVPYDTAFTDSLQKILNAHDFPAGTEYDRGHDLTEDHGTMVPLYFLYKAAGRSVPVVRIGLSGLSLASHYQFGMYLKEAIEASPKRYFVVASGDLSHCQKEDGPYGFHPEGPEYDERIMKTMGSARFEELLHYDPAFLEASMECGHRSFTILSGILDRTDVTPHVLSHEAPFGVGYGIVTYEIGGRDERRNFLEQYEAADRASISSKAEDAYVQLARQSVESWVRSRTMMDVPSGLPREMLDGRAGTFVSLHEYGELRGCIGTIRATCDSIAEEIIQNAISACSRDPRFPAVTADELSHLVISVDVLSDPEPVQHLSELDAKRYGVIVTKGHRRGLLLPNLEGVDTPAQQIDIACRKAGIDCRKAGIDPDEDGIELQRFEVVRHE